jgi:membrane protein implicated in regulation of membrane protease activity
MITQKDERTMVKWTIIILLWIVVLVVALFFVKWNICLGSWAIITGITMFLKRKAYKDWYNRVYDTDF